MPKKKRGKRKDTGITAATRASDDRLREALRKADLGVFDKALEKTIRPAR